MRKFVILMFFAICGLVGYFATNAVIHARNVSGDPVSYMAKSESKASYAESKTAFPDYNEEQTVKKFKRYEVTITSNPFYFEKNENIIQEGYTREQPK